MILGIVIVVLGIYSLAFYHKSISQSPVGTAVETPASPEISTTFKVFFACCGPLTQEVRPVERPIVDRKSPIKEAIEVLLLGPLEEEKMFTSEKGEKRPAYWTAIPEGTQLIDLQVNDNQICLTFTDRLVEGVTGSAQYCILIHDQIVNTVEQFGFSEDEIIISAPGKNPDEMLQP